MGEIIILPNLSSFFHSRVTLVIRAGTVNLTQPTAIFETSKYYNHPLYNEALQSIVQPNDIGLIEFGRRLEFSSKFLFIIIFKSRGMYCYAYTLNNFILIGSLV